MRLTHRVHTSASVQQVWALLDQPSAWPQFLMMLRRVRGTDGAAAAGQRLLGVTRFTSIGIPVDVLEAVRDTRLTLLVHTAPGVRERVTCFVTPAVRGGSEIEVSAAVEGPLAPLAALPLFVATGLSTHLLAARAQQAARARRGAA